MALTRAGEGNGIYINPHVVGGIGLLITSGVLLASRSIPASVTEVLPRSATPQAGTIVAVTDDFLIDISMEAMVKRYRPNSPYKSYPSCASAIGALQTDKPEVVLVSVNSNPAWTSLSVVNDLTCAQRLKIALAASQSSRLCLVANDLIDGDSMTRNDPFQFPPTAIRNMERVGYQGNVYSCVIPQNNATAWQIALQSKP
jgi:hypothetical protein